MATVIGPTLLVEGEIAGEERLVVEGTVQGKIEVKDGVEVPRSGVVRAEIVAESITISGQLNGRASAKTRVELTPEGRMAGDIRAPRVVIADGAQYKGNIDMG
jgi:cytoskeletal protein CcmA (bactofilin family)